MSNDVTQWPIAQERRLHVRHQAKTELTILRDDGKRLKTRLVDLSASGCCALTPNFQLYIGEVVDMVFFIRLSSVIKIHRRKARVVWSRMGKSGFSLYSYEPVR